MITSLVILGQPVGAVIFLAFLTQNPIVIGAVIVVYVVAYVLVHKTWTPFTSSSRTARSTMLWVGLHRLRSSPGARRKNRVAGRWVLGSSCGLHFDSASRSA